MNRTEKLIASTGLGIGAVFGISGSLYSEPVVLQSVLYEISSIGLVVAAALLTVKYIRRNNDLLATGFLVFAIGEAIMTVGIPLGPGAGIHAFAAGMALYVPALLFISIPKTYPTWTRVTGIAAIIPFGISASKVFMGGQILYTDPLPGIGYGLLVLTIIGWIWTIMKDEGQ